MLSSLLIFFFSSTPLLCRSRRSLAVVASFVPREHAFLFVDLRPRGGGGEENGNSKRGGGITLDSAPPTLLFGCSRTTSPGRAPRRLASFVPAAAGTRLLSGSVRCRRRRSSSRSILVAVVGFFVRGGRGGRDFFSTAAAVKTKRTPPPPPTPGCVSLFNVHSSCCRSSGPK